MPWIIEKIEHAAYTAKWGECLADTCRYDPYSLACVIEDRGDGIAYIANAMGLGVMPEREDLKKKLIALGFKKVRWIRIIEQDLVKNV